MDKLIGREARDIWDELMDRIDLSGNYEAFIDPREIENLVNQNERLREVLTVCKKVVEIYEREVEIYEREEDGVALRLANEALSNKESI